MGNNPLNKAASAADKLAKLEAEEAARKAKQQAEEAERKRKEAEADAKKRAKAEADKNEAKRLENKIKNLLLIYEPSEYWERRSREVFNEVYDSHVKNLISKSVWTEFMCQQAIAQHHIIKQRDKKRAIKTLFTVLGVVAVALVSLLAVAFGVYSWLMTDNVSLFRIAFAAQIVSALGVGAIAVVHFVKDTSAAQKLVCVILAALNLILAVAMGFSGGLVTRDLFTDSDGFTYENKDGEIYLVGCEGSVKELVISALSESIVGISDQAFKGNTTITSLTVDVSNLTIGNEAFADCSALEKVELVGGDTALGGKVFKDCVKLNSVSFEGGSYTFNGASVFDGCTVLKDIHFNGGSYVGADGARILGGLKKIAVHHRNADIAVSLKGADELTLVVYSGTDSIFAVEPDVLVFAEGFDFSGEFGAERGTFDLKPLAPVTFFPSSVTYIPDILGSDRKKSDVYYQGSSDMWESLGIAGDGGLFDVANMNYKEDYVRMHYNSNCRFWGTNNVEG